MRTQLIAPIAALVFSCVSSAVTAAETTSCNVVNLMPALWQSIHGPRAAKEVRKAVVDPNSALYNADFVSLPTGAKWEEEVKREQAYVKSNRKDIEAVEKYLSAYVQPYMTAFKETFPDYQCDYTFYIAPSFGRMDGSAASVDGRHVVIFAPDVIPKYHKVSELKVLIDHETFHIYHHQSTGVYGASEEVLPTIEEALWGEGLATFVSAKMNPDASMDTVMLQPGIPEGAKPYLADIAKELLTHLDEKDKPTYAAYFMAGSPPKGYPPRAGYYVGLLIAQSLAERYSLPELAHLKGPELHELLVSQLKQLAAAR